jgi:hypothetical protein
MKRYARMLFDLALFAGVMVMFAILTACATVRHDPAYDGEVLLSAPTADSSLYVPIHIENHRTIDALPPTFYLTGSGRHSLGIVQGVDGKLDRLIDTSWFGADGCMTITAHYVGWGDLVFDRFCWRPGERIDVALDNIFNPVAAWSHR